jgi:hypothetical protein
MPAAAPTPDVPVLKDKRPRETVDDELVPLLIFDKSDGVVTIILGLSNSKYLASPSAIVIKSVVLGVVVAVDVGRVLPKDVVPPNVVLVNVKFGANLALVTLPSLGINSPT